MRAIALVALHVFRDSVRDKVLYAVVVFAVLLIAALYGARRGAATAMTYIALGLMEPVNCGPGGDLFAIVYEAKTKKLHGLNASGRSPLGLTLASSH